MTNITRKVAYIEDKRRRGQNNAACRRDTYSVQPRNTRLTTNRHLAAADGSRRSFWPGGSGRKRSGGCCAYERAITLRRRCPCVWSIISMPTIHIAARFSHMKAHRKTYVHNNTTTNTTKNNSNNLTATTPKAKERRRVPGAYVCACVPVCAASRAPASLPRSPSRPHPTTAPPAPALPRPFGKTDGPPSTCRPPTERNKRPGQPRHSATYLAHI